jgi:hypothetical protein
MQCSLGRPHPECLVKRCDSKQGPTQSALSRGATPSKALCDVRRRVGPMGAGFQRERAVTPHSGTKHAVPQAAGRARSAQPRSASSRRRARLRGRPRPPPRPRAPRRLLRRRDGAARAPQSAGTRLPSRRRAPARGRRGCRLCSDAAGLQACMPVQAGASAGLSMRGGACQEPPRAKQISSSGHGMKFGAGALAEAGCAPAYSRAYERRAVYTTCHYPVTVLLAKHVMAGITLYGDASALSTPLCSVSVMHCATAGATSGLTFKM